MKWENTLKKMRPRILEAQAKRFPGLGMMRVIMLRSLANFLKEPQTNLGKSKKLFSVG
jgi:hypothetical protein